MKSSIILLCCLLFGLAAASFTEKQYQNAFLQWMKQQQKSYGTSEFQERYVAFKANMDFIQVWNSDPSHTHTVGLNKFADITNEEYRKIYLTNLGIDGAARLAAAKPHVALNVKDDDVNWANAGAVTPIKDQGQCGSCWSFSTTGSVEGLNQISTGNLISLSEQNLMDCSTASPNNACNGGNVDVAFQYIISNGGIDTEDSYPYQAQPSGGCNYDPSNIGATIANYRDCNSGDEGDLTNSASQQPVSVAIDASQQSFQLYSGGVYSDGGCSTTNLDHAVLVIGYGTDNNGGGDYYIVKNSWGTGWGMSGYIWMARNDGNMCGIATMASVPLSQ